MPFRIVPRTNLSLSDLLGRSRHGGCYVVKTPHVGNIYPNNLAVAALGIPILLVDQNITAQDPNFHPDLVIAGGRSEVVADPARLTSHARVTRASERFPDRFAVGRSLADAHVQALRDVLPSARIETVSARSHRMSDLLMPALEALTDMKPASWKRCVGQDGVISTATPPRTWAEVARTGVHGISPDGCGWTIPNAWNILCDGVIGAQLTGRDIVYSLSGPDMIHYYPGLLSEIEAGYEVIRARVAPDLPETLTMIMVPVADMRFVTIRRRAAALESLVDAYLRLRAFNRDAGARLSVLSGAAKHQAVTTVAAERGCFQDALRDAVGDCPEIFYDIKQANCLTQYDLLGGEELYVSPWATAEPIERLTEALGLFRRLVRHS